MVIMSMAIVVKKVKKVKMVKMVKKVPFSSTHLDATAAGTYSSQ